MAKEISSWAAVDGTIHKTREAADLYEFNLVLGKLANVNPASMHEEQVKRLWLRRFELAGFILGSYKLTEKMEIVEDEKA